MPANPKYIRSRIEEIRECLKELKRLYGKKYGELSIDERYSIRYQIIVLAESIGSLAIHICEEEFSHRAESYTEALLYLEKKDFIRCASELVSLIRLRNLLVHRYWEIKDEKVHENMRRNFTCVEEFIEKVSRKYGSR